ncbi:MAG: exodeoxyribonuclease VII large subunit, partial [Spirochaetia bacterium]|nr:exodeoxyribonuclease VII large subunit [Spirochaetia bacterium]
MSDRLQVDLTVTELTQLIKRTLEEGFYALRVTGEISNFRPSSTGHWFFTLKDSSCAISAVMFKSVTWKVGFLPKEGDKVTVLGSLDVYGSRGTYQIKCESMEKSGSGDILALLEKRKQRYAELGYFDQKCKKPIPKQISTVGVVSSPTGAALRDILNILHRRAPSLSVLVLPATVQGESAAQSIARRIRQANELLLCDILIVGRGGGAIEDLLPFSEDEVIQAIHDSEIPVISAVGHEIDFTISDFVADMRAPTPSAAAELVSQGFLDILHNIKTIQSSLIKEMLYRINIASQQVKQWGSASLQRSVLAIMERREYLLANADNNLQQELKQRLAICLGRYEIATRELQALNPLAILARGYT